ncbi:MAG: ATPase domain-containing protein [Candidatus Bathycorpusculaceae bacterium]
MTSEELDTQTPPPCEMTLDSESDLGLGLDSELGRPVRKRFTPTGAEALDAVLGGGFPRNSLIVLAGNPGVGKTMFCARFLYSGAVSYGENGVYVSLAEGRETFYGNMKTLGFNFEGLEQAGKFRFLDLLTVKEEAVPSLVDFVVERAGEVKAERLVLDSYSAFAQAFRDPVDARIFIHTVLSKLIRNMGCTTLLIKESQSMDDENVFGVEEFVADGVIRLTATELEDRRLRTLEILKLRGARLKEPKLVFTLERGFKAFRQFELKPAKKPRPFQPAPDPPGKYSTGSNTLDKALGGGLPKGSIMLLECNEKVSAGMSQILLDPFIANFVFQGRGVITLLPAGVDHLAFKESLEAYGANEEQWKRCVRIIMAKPYMPAEGFPGLIAVEGEDWREDLKRVLEGSRELIAQTGQPALSIVGASALVALYGERRCTTILNIAATLAKSAKGALIMLAGAGDNDLAIRLSPLADVYLRLTREHGCPILCGVKPRTPLYVVEADTSKGYALPKITPIL